MNWYHRGEQRYVEYGSSFPATRAFGVRPLALRHRLQHEHGAPHAGPPDRLRAPRRRRAADRLHHLPDLPRSHAPRPVGGERLPAIARGGAVPPPGVRRDASSSTRTCSTPATPAAARRSACPASATSTPAASAPTWSRTTCSTSCSSRCPTTTPTRTSAGPYAPGHARSRRPTARSSGIMHVAGGLGPRSWTSTRVIVMSDHSQTSVEERVNLAEAFSSWRRAHALGPGTDGGAEIAVCPAARSAQVYVLDRSPAATSWCREPCTTLQELEGVDLVARPGEGTASRCAPSAASCASRRAASSPIRAARSWSAGGRSSRAARWRWAAGTVTATSTPTRWAGSGPR